VVETSYLVPFAEVAVELEVVDCRDTFRKARARGKKNEEQQGAQQLEQGAAHGIDR
jgi:hypothetical protein